MSSQQTHLLVLDTPAIKKYVFESNKLAEIVGASGLLAKINHEELKPVIEETVSSSGGGYEVIYLAGGGGQVILKGVQETTIRNPGKSKISGLFMTRPQRSINGFILPGLLKADFLLWEIACSMVFSKHE